MTIQALSYFGLEVTDVDAWRSFAEDVLGLLSADDIADGTARFRMDSRAWRIEVTQGPADDLSFVGFEVADAQAFEEARERIERLGVSTHSGSEGLARRRGVLDLFYFSDPTGMQVEIFYGATELFEKPFHSPAGVSGFVTGGQGVGHVVLLVPNLIQARTFYEEVVGLRVTDIIDMPTAAGTIELVFMNCNPRHHSIAMGQASIGKRLDHFLLQVASLDDMGFAYDRALNAKMPIRATIGRHSNDHMVSFYAFTPSGVAVEYGWGARELNETWRVVRYDTASLWGHHELGPSKGY